MTRADRMMAKFVGHMGYQERARHEKWVRVQADLPPEQVDEMMRLYKATMGVNHEAASKAGLVRTALLAWWEARDPEPAEAIEGTATDIDIDAMADGQTAGLEAPPERLQIGAREDSACVKGRVRDLVTDDVFAFQGRDWRVISNRCDKVRVQSKHGDGIEIWFYDPVTAKKSGELSWDTTVEVIS